MRIIHVTENYDPALGGLERHVQVLAGSQAAAGHEVLVVSLARPDSPVRQRDSCCPGVTVVRLDSLTRRVTRGYDTAAHHFLPPAPDPLFAVRLSRVSAAFAPDVVHTHGWVAHSVVASGLPERTALVHTLHEYGLVCAKQTYTRVPTGCPDGPGRVRCIRCATGTYGAAKAVLTVAALRADRGRLQRVDRYLAISHAVAGTCRPTTGERPVDIVPTFVRDGLAEVARTSPRPAWLPDPAYLLFVGALGLHKGVGVLLDAWRALPDRPPLVLCGPTRPDTPPLDDPGLTVRTDVPHEEVMAAWRGAVIGVVPSVWPEPFGQVAVEGLAAGVPVVASDTGGLPEILGDGHGVLCPPGDAAALADALAHLIADPGERARLGARGPQRARTFEISVLLPRIMASYAAARASRGAA